MRVFLFLFSVVLCYGMAVQSSEAYLTTAQSAQKLSSGSALFLIEYHFGTKNNAVYMPFITAYGTSTATNTLSYQIFDDEGTAVSGKVAGIVLSDATYSTKDMMYIAPKGLSNKFILAVLFTSDSYDPEKKYRLQVTHLPFSFNGEHQLKLNPSELTYYTTDLISL